MPGAEDLIELVSGTSEYALRGDNCLFRLRESTTKCIESVLSSGASADAFKGPKLIFQAIAKFFSEAFASAILKLALICMSLRRHWNAQQ